MIGTLLLHPGRVGGSLLNRLSLRVWHVGVMMNIAVWIARFIVHHYLGLSRLHAVAFRTVLSHNRHSDRRLVGKMIGVAPTRTAGAVGRELVDTRNSTGKMASERREIHCKPSIKYLE